MKTPTPEEFSDVLRLIDRTDSEVYNEMHLDTLLMGICIGKGMYVPDAVRFVQENPVEDNRR